MDLSKEAGLGMGQWGDGQGEGGAAERGRRDGQSGFPASKMLQQLLISHPS